jgi:pSer/pThr/pTyr-binding forkhead associated (FHA) protein
MARPMLGELMPKGGGDAIPMIKSTMTLGRLESCDICLRFPNISSIHCEFSYHDGYWSIRDRDSTNGIKVNGERLRFRPLRPGDRITIGKRDYEIQYEMHAAGQKAIEAVLTESEDIYQQTLMEKAGLTKPSRNPAAFDFPRNDDDDDGMQDDD